jgi:hypothetical protein
MHALVSLWRKAIDVAGDYVEKITCVKETSSYTVRKCHTFWVNSFRERKCGALLSEQPSYLRDVCRKCLIFFTFDYRSQWNWSIKMRTNVSKVHELYNEIITLVLFFDKWMFLLHRRIGVWFIDVECNEWKRISRQLVSSLYAASQAVMWHWNLSLWLLELLCWRLKRLHSPSVCFSGDRRYC